MTDFVLLHGGGMGGWAWKFVRPLLESKGHRVLTPTYTGFGEREHLTGRDVGNAVHVRDVCNVLRYEEVADAVLVGHSYSGTVIPGVIAAEGDRIAAIVYLDAIVAHAGERILSLVGFASEADAAALDAVLDSGEGPVGSGVDEQVRAMSKEQPAIMDPAREQWMLAMLSDQPLRATTGVITVGAESIAAPVHYVAAAHTIMLPMHERARSLGWTIMPHPGDHSLHIGDPEGTTALVLEAAGLA